MKKNKKLIFFCIVIILLIVLHIFFSSKNSKDDVLELVDIKKTINVDIKGAVKSPGVKKVEVGSTVDDLIKASGGLLESADTSIINLSKELKNEMVVIVYTTDEVNEMKSGSTSVKIVEKECICPQIENSACIDNNNVIEANGNKADSNNYSNKVSLNSASKDELMTLTGIGATKADAIIEYRKTNKFKTIEEITNVNGIGKSTFEKIKNNITV